jgi:hypothetical protein
LSSWKAWSLISSLQFLVQRQPLVTHGWTNKRNAQGRPSGRAFHPAHPHTHHIHLPGGYILAILSDTKSDRSCRSTQMVNTLLPALPPFLPRLQARQIPTDQAASGIPPSLDHIDAGRVRFDNPSLRSVTLTQMSHSVADGGGQSHVEAPPSTIVRWRDTDPGCDTQAAAQERAQNSHKRILCIGGFGIERTSFPWSS